MIDVHTHLHPPRLFAAIRRWFAERSSWQLEHPTEPTAVAAALRTAGVERFVFCSYAHRAGMAREINAWLTETARDLDGYGLPLATIHLADSQPQADLAAALADGCVGLKIHEDVQAVAIDDPRFDPAYTLLAEREAFVLAHVGPIPWDQDTRGGPRRVEAVRLHRPICARPRPVRRSKQRIRRSSTAATTRIFRTRMSPIAGRSTRSVCRLRRVTLSGA